MVLGNLDYFRRYVRASGVLRFDDDAETELRFADDGCRFVLGGDAVQLSCSSSARKSMAATGAKSQTSVLWYV